MIIVTARLKTCHKVWADSHFKCNMSRVLILDEYAFVTARLKAEIYLQIHNRLIE